MYVKEHGKFGGCPSVLRSAVPGHPAVYAAARVLGSPILLASTHG